MRKFLFKNQEYRFTEREQSHLFSAVQSHFAAHQDLPPDQADNNPALLLIDDALKVMGDPRSNETLECGMPQSSAHGAKAARMFVGRGPQGVPGAPVCCWAIGGQSLRPEWPVG